MKNLKSPGTCPPGLVEANSGADIARYCLCSVQHGGEIRKNLKPAKITGTATFFHAKDLNVFREREKARMMARAANLTSDEREQIFLVGSEMSMRAGGREYLLAQDQAAGDQAVRDWVSASTELRQTMAAQRQAAEGYASAAVQLSQGVNQMTAVVSNLSSQMQALTGLLKRYAMAKSATR